MTDIQKKIRDARPSLFSVDPKTFLISWAFVFLNLVLGVYFFNTHGSNLRVPVATGLLNTTAWGTIFVLLALWMGIELLKNNWKGIRLSMIYCMFVKAFWSYALLYIAIRDGVIPILASIGLWFFIFAVQAIVLIYFLPKDIVIQSGRHNI